MQANVFSRTPIKEHLLFAIVGLIAVVYSIFASRLPTDWWPNPLSARQKRMNRVFYLAVSGFMFIWGIAHLVRDYWR